MRNAARTGDSTLPKTNLVPLQLLTHVIDVTEECSPSAQNVNAYTLDDEWPADTATWARSIDDQSDSFVAYKGVCLEFDVAAMWGKCTLKHPFDSFI